jgi:dihydrofolate reductase
MKISLIAAFSENRVIGIDNRIPWRITEDLKRFKKITLGHTVVMGRKTYESLKTPLPGRKNLVLSRQKNYKADGALVCRSLDEAITKSEDEGEEEVFIIGGGQIYEEALPISDRLYITLIHKEIEGDTFFPTVPDNKFKKVFEEKKCSLSSEVSFSFIVLERATS